MVVPHDELLVVPHDELYLVVEGRARFVCDDEPVELAKWRGALRATGCPAWGGRVETPTMLLIVGGRPGQVYSPPIWRAIGASRTASSCS
ncbi:MAG TPA: hypothetical protein VFR38_16395 [Gaiellaceae bacterium]|nr:hypothetical protein [Gaiellaceae bacterium]